jgi:hypothetical protein
MKELESKTGKEVLSKLNAKAALKQHQIEQNTQNKSAKKK